MIIGAGARITGAAGRVMSAGGALIERVRSRGRQEDDGAGALADRRAGHDETRDLARRGLDHLSLGAEGGRREEQEDEQSPHAFQPV